eukprot:7454581-Alexandrium_andersonii.AAC.1
MLAAILEGKRKEGAAPATPKHDEEMDIADDQSDGSDAERAELAERLHAIGETDIAKSLRKKIKESPEPSPKQGYREADNFLEQCK